MASEDLSPTPHSSSLFQSSFFHSPPQFLLNHSSPSPSNPLFLSPSPSSNPPPPLFTSSNNADQSPFPAHLHSPFRTPPLKKNYGKDCSQPQLSGPATIRKHSNLIVDHKIDPQSSPAGRRNNRAKFPKNAKSGDQKLNAETLDGLNPATGCRYDSSLGLLTKKFVKLVQEKDGTLDLNKSADVLQVQKRRIYDITNVLEGIDLIEKTSKNHIRWKGYDGSGSKELDNQATNLKDEVQRLRAEERRLDEYIREKQNLLRAIEEDENNKQYLFLTEEDITRHSCFQNQTLIAVKAPQASYLEVPDPDEEVGSPQYKMVIRSSTGPIDLYLLSKYKQKDEDVAVKQARKCNSAAQSQRCGPDRMVTEELCLRQQQQQQQNNVNEIFSSIHPESSGMQKIIPSDCDIGDDYWFHSDTQVSISELWG